MAGHEEVVVEFVDLAVGAHVWRCPEAHALNVHVFLNVFEFLDYVCVEFTSVVPGGGNEDDFVAWDLDAHSDWRS